MIDEARVYLVVGAKGGVGATTIALGLAEQLETTRPRVVVDADLAGRRSVAVLHDLTAELDTARVRGDVAFAKAHGFTLLELARTYEEAFLLQAADVEEATTRLPGSPLVVVDAPQPFAAVVRPFISRAAQIVIVTEPTLLGVASARAMLAAMERFGIPTQRIAFVLNNPHGVNELRRNEIQQALKIPIAAELPPSRDRGYGRAFKQLCAHLSEAPDAVKLTTLRQSTGKPIGDRREEKRDFNAGPPPPNAANAGKVIPINGAAQQPAPSQSRSEPRLATADREKLKTEIHAVMMRRIDFFSAARAHSGTAQLAELRTQVDAIADEYLAAHRGVATAEEAARIRAEVAEEALGLGPIESLLDDPSVSEIMVNGHANIFVEKGGHIERTVKQFADDRQVRLVIERIIAPLGRRLDESSPMVDARLPDGSRVNAVIEPLAIDGPSLTIRRFGKTRLDMNGLVERGALTPAMADFLRAAVEARLNVIVSGGTGSGKTTLLNSLSSFIPKSDRIVTVEDAAELKLDQPHVVRLESRPANLEGKGAISIRDLVRNSLRMRPDRIVVGECRSGEALDMLQAMNTGHDGSMTTIHANTPRDACARVETLVLMAGFDLPVRAIREQIAGAIDVIVQVARLRDGSRKVTAISELVGMEGEVVTMQELVRFEQQGLDAQGTVKGEFVMSGVQPACLRRFEEVGVAFDAGLFSTAPGRKAVGTTWLR